MKEKENSLISKTVFLLVISTLVLNPLLIFTLTKDNFILPKEIFINVLICLAFVFWSIKAVLEKKIVWSHLSLFLLCFWLTQIISLYFCTNLYAGNRKFFFSLSCILIYFLASQVHKEKEIYLFLNSIILVGVITAVIGLSQYLEIKIFFPKLYSQEEWKYKAFSTLGNPQFLAALLIIIFPLSISLLLSARSKLWYVLSSSLTGLGILVTNTRGAWLSIGITTILMFALLYKYRSQALVPKSESSQHNYLSLFLRNLNKNALSAFILSLIVVSLVFSVAYTKTHKKVPSIIKQFALLLPKNNTSVEGRIFTWKTAWEIIKQNPLRGQGIGNFKVVYPHFKAKLIQKIKISNYTPDFFTRREYAHNEYLELWAESGLLGLLFFLFFLAAHFKFMFSSIANSKKSRQPLKIGLLGSTLSPAIFAFIFFPFQIPSTGLLFFFLAGLAISPANNMDNEYSEKALKYFSVPLNSKLILGEIAVIFYVFILIINIQLLLPDYYLKQGEQYLRQQKPEAAIKSFQKGLAKNSDKGELYYALGYVHQDRGRYDEALTYFQKTLLLLPEKGVYYSLANIYAKQKLLNKAIFYYKKCLSIDPSFADAYLNLGIMYIKANLPQQAIENFQKALHYAQDKIAEITSLNNMANCYYLSGDKPNAKITWKKMLRKLAREKDINIPNLERIKTIVNTDFSQS